MGFENQQNEKARYFYFQDGKYHEFQSLQEVPDLTVTCTTTENCKAGMWNGDLLITGYIKRRKVSRKRLVKLLMAHGARRNEANAMAQLVRKMGWRYSDASILPLLY